MNKFQSLDRIGRDKFKSFLEQYNIEYSDMYDLCGYDIVFKRHGKSYNAEIKGRSSIAEKFSTLILERDKFETLKKHQHNFDRTFYVNFVGDKMYIYTVEMLEEILKGSGWVLKWMNEKTAVSNHKIQKVCLEIPKTDAVLYIFDGNKWNRVRQ